jgi:hypothetical protein
MLEREVCPDPLDEDAADLYVPTVHHPAYLPWRRLRNWKNRVRQIARWKASRSRQLKDPYLITNLSYEHAAQTR